MLTSRGWRFGRAVFQEYLGCHLCPQTCLKQVWVTLGCTFGVLAPGKAAVPITQVSQAAGA